MAIPEHIKQMERPISTVVKQRGNRLVVIKRTNRREGIVDVKDYGEVAICHQKADGLSSELAQIWALSDLKRL